MDYGKVDVKGAYLDSSVSIDLYLPTRLNANPSGLVMTKYSGKNCLILNTRLRVDVGYSPALKRPGIVNYRVFVECFVEILQIDASWLVITLEKML
jgi:hypothetical protein